ncbi:hypothetical protein [Nocardiopsis sp. LOL_012]|uniref:hypothetical protein n=1 Tax=Nocardiopsis sp. LOL_012 TaxID=3345409 RepID=UPI003A89CB83
MGETTRCQVHERFTATLALIVAGLTRAGIRVSDPRAADPDAGLHHWQGCVWNCAHDLAGLESGEVWASTDRVGGRPPAGVRG